MISNPFVLGFIGGFRDFQTDVWYELYHTILDMHISRGPLLVSARAKARAA